MFLNFAEELDSSEQLMLLQRLQFKAQSDLAPLCAVA